MVPIFGHRRYNRYFIVMSITILWIVPIVFSFGHASNIVMGFTPMYDAPLMLQFAISLVWAQMLIVIAGLAMIIAGLTGNLNQKTADWWRLRVHGLLVILLALSLPQVGGMIAEELDLPFIYCLFVLKSGSSFIFVLSY